MNAVGEAPPAPPFRTPFFYGWVVVAMSMVAGFLSVGSSQIVMGILVRPLISEREWSLTATTGAFTTAGLLAGALSPAFGALADRFGARWLYPIGAGIFAVAMLGIASVEGLVQFYGLYVAARLASVGFLSGVVPMTTVTNWFTRRRGRAAGLISMSIPVGNAFWASFGQHVITTGGWRSMFNLLATCMAVSVIVPGSYLMRRRPEDVGLQPDGPAAASPLGGQSPAVNRPVPASHTLGEALRTRALWLLGFGQLVGVSAWATVAFHTPSFVATLGFSPTTGAAAISAASLAGALSSVFLGWLSERYSERNLTVMVGIGSAVFLRLMALPLSDVTVIAASFVYGLTARSESSLYGLVLAAYFGRDAYGKISGFIAPFTLAGVSLGPLIGSVAFDLTGTYQGLYLVLSGVHLLGALLVFLARPPGPPRASPAVGSAG